MALLLTSIFVLLFICLITTGLLKKKKIFFPLLVITVLFTGYQITTMIQVINEKQKEQIAHTVSEQGGTLVEYEKVSVHQSPFESFGISTDAEYQIYKVKVNKNGKPEIGWYRTVNAVVGSDEGEWIWEPRGK
ncbi:hypothetical protein JOC85_003707 [Bacillus mesophilus]|uniref:DUF3139 domain-containing protein n=1 Tax=Bacillus mesophilus TaxID=1808955 RepID=A0A6M0QAZ2_9BACI|nr:hypothetical protein [Bacillus mesophilus]MBM7662896.1 hypothetical protein [Bacillus mesophilus]NEY73485.1 hypothetical protein [Bacillus mesophilus]